MVKDKLVSCCALFWGLVVFMPVGMNYFAFFALGLATLVTGTAGARWGRVRAHPLYWPLAMFVVWTLAVLALQPVWYAETPSNLWHGARIVLTLALALALTPDEALWALRGFLAAAILSLCIIGVHAVAGLPELAVWRHLIHYSGNKSIANGLLMAVLAGSAVVLALSPVGKMRLLAVAVLVSLTAVLVFVLPSRTALLMVLLALLTAVAHQWRHHQPTLFSLLALALLASALFVAAVPEVRSRLAQGASEVQQAVDGEVAYKSWNIRVQMIRHTGAMVLERPWMGWGIGAWNDQWRKRVPPLLADLNMPHNDLLWMGAQAGVPGALVWLLLLLAACRAGWRRQDVVGRVTFVAAVTLLLSALVNSATRDAVIGLSLLWVVGVYLRLAADPQFDLRMVFARARPVAA
ncbi:MAG: O-antigen ligase family protein [Rhodoferax sp.]|nr:O-antigen ligase family protein [Rhodoferax sp.]